ncbi:MAG: GNAT family N-acetyltransferase [Clostridium sp.]|nr:GNAT family N-acetyltransferase [Clostridium sp.]
MAIYLKQVTQNNWYDCTELDVYEEQKGIVAPNYNSIIVSLLFNNWYSRCIYNDDKLIGYILYGIEEETNKTMLLRYMIDKEYQGKGLGKEALSKLFDLIRVEYGNIKFYTIYDPENDIAQNLYKTVGFNKTGEILWDEDLLEIQL